MIYILYNDKSNQGRPIREAKRLEKKFKKQKKEFLSFSIFDIDQKEVEFHQQLTSNDQLILIGGDGTLHHYFNQIYPRPIAYRVFVKACGRGNDFARDYKKHKLFEITHLVNDFPKLKINGQEEYVFLNGIGMGVDSLVCLEQLKNAKLKIKESYFKVAIRVFKKFKPYTLDIEIDGVSYHYEKVWFFVCNHGCYFGGGMKITPMAKREDPHLDICIVHHVHRRKILLIFPIVFLGLHRFILKKYIHFYTAKQVRVNPHGCNILQKDGEIAEAVNSIEIER